MVGAIDVASHAIETPEGGWNPAQGAGVRRCRQTLPVHQLRYGAAAAHVATGKLHALSAGAEIIRRELAAK